MQLSRRGILGGLFATTAASAAFATAPPASIPSPPTPPLKQRFPKGYILPRFHLVNNPSHSHGYSTAAHGHGYSTAAMVNTDYDIFDGEKFVPFNSAAGQQVIADLS